MLCEPLKEDGLKKRFVYNLIDQEEIEKASININIKVEKVSNDSSAENAILS